MEEERLFLLSSFNAPYWSLDLGPKPIKAFLAKIIPRKVFGLVEPKHATQEDFSGCFLPLSYPCPTPVPALP